MFGFKKIKISRDLIHDPTMIEKSGTIEGFVTIEVFRANGEYELICKDKPNLLTTSGRDVIHAQVYTNTSAGRRGCGFIALTTDTGAAAAGDTTLAQELTTSGMARADATTKTHSAGTNTTTIQNTFTATGTVTAIVKSALFDNPTLGASTSNMIHENTFASVNLVLNDTLQATWTITAG